MTDVDPMIGRLIGEKYRVIDYVGGGGFGAVYRAEQEPVGRVVAVKVIKKSNKDEEELRARFLRSPLGCPIEEPAHRDALRLR